MYPGGVRGPQRVRQPSHRVYHRHLVLLRTYEQQEKEKELTNQTQKFEGMTKTSSDSSTCPSTWSMFMTMILGHLTLILGSVCSS